jgi:hypothetical protein
MRGTGIPAPEVDWGGDGPPGHARTARRGRSRGGVRRVLPVGVATQVQAVEAIPGDFCAPAALERYPYHLAEGAPGACPGGLRRSPPPADRLRRMSSRPEPPRKFALVFVAFSLALTVGGGVWALGVTSRALEKELDEKLLWMAGADGGCGAPADPRPSVPSGGRGGFRALALWQNPPPGFLPYVEEAYVFHRDRVRPPLDAASRRAPHRHGR